MAAWDFNGAVAYARTVIDEYHRETEELSDDDVDVDDDDGDVLRIVYGFL
jgi:hypothetical protein